MLTISKAWSCIYCLSVLQRAGGANSLSPHAPPFQDHPYNLSPSFQVWGWVGPRRTRRLRRGPGLPSPSPAPPRAGPRASRRRRAVAGQGALGLETAGGVEAAALRRRAAKKRPHSRRAVDRRGGSGRARRVWRACEEEKCRDWRPDALLRAGAHPPPRRRCWGWLIHLAAAVTYNFLLGPFELASPMYWYQMCPRLRMSILRIYLRPREWAEANFGRRPTCLAWGAANDLVNCILLRIYIASMLLRQAKDSNKDHGNPPFLRLHLKH